MKFIFETEIFETSVFRFALQFILSLNRCDLCLCCVCACVRVCVCARKYLRVHGTSQRNEFLCGQFSGRGARRLARPKTFFFVLERESGGGNLQ